MAELVKSFGLLGNESLDDFRYVHRVPLTARRWFGMAIASQY